ncbi:5'-nucleotidase C-terminal domain-containing protein [Pseudosulfitobacter koreensis]|uniref:5'-nucleotidase C-terminal domain-containing protein n=1 Tax=Pseudosulfitobacter koreensis TaxID=2968472 RepID=A0ABT1YVZ4_9RHOB|nr:5'-nucleotidase C-terminal domain-containing protein [Pseudosulfitobacter koreense]MCR8825046.1 5'-nucleotidase C-terminal domain-containing protein [Pseudosulfitobacter koreense]
MTSLTLPLRDTTGAPLIVADLCILATSDVHMHLTAHDHTLDVKRPEGGLSRVVTLIEQARAARPDALVLTVDNGDLLQGAAMADVMTTPAHLAQHPVADCLTLGGYDAIGLGNHDIDYGLRITQRLLGGLNCPVLCANLETETMPCLRPYALLQHDIRGDDGQMHPICVGVTSVLPEETRIWNFARMAQADRFSDPVVRLAALIPQMKAEGADLIVVLAHTGIAEDTATDRHENFALAIARLPDVTAIVCGHTHLALPGPDHDGIAGVDAGTGHLHGVPAVMAGFGARALGVIDLQLVRSDAGWQVRHAHSTRQRAGDDTAEHPAILRATHAASALTEAHMAAPVGHADEHLHSFFAHICADGATHLLAHSMKRTVARAARGTDVAALAVLVAASTTASGGAGRAQNFLNVPPGAVSRRQVSIALPYSDTVWAACATGAEVLEWLERSAVAFNQLGPAPPDQMVMRADVPGFQFDVIYGLEVTFDPTQPPRYAPTGRLIDPSAHRVATARWQGVPLDPRQRFLVVANSFRLAGGGAFPGLAPDRIALRTDTTLTSAVIDALAEGAPPPLPTDTWRFKKGLGVSAIVHTSPQAIHHLDQIAAHAPQPLGTTDDGFLKLRISL